MPRITKKMKQEELKALEHKLSEDARLCLGYGVNTSGNVVNEYGDRLVIGKDGNKKFIKYGDGPFNRREVKFDPINNYQMMSQMFGSFIQQEVEDVEKENDPFKYIRSIVIKDDDVTVDGVTKKYVEIDVMSGKIQSEKYYTPTLGYLEIMLDRYGTLPMCAESLKRLDELKHELEQ